MSAHPAPRATRATRAETAGSSALALGPNQRGKAGGEVEASNSVMTVAAQRTCGTVWSILLRLYDGRHAASRPFEPQDRSGTCHTAKPLGGHSGTLAQATESLVWEPGEWCDPRWLVQAFAFR